MTTYLDVQHYPDVFQSGLGKILKKVGQARHWLVRLVERSQLAQKLVVAVNELLVSAKAALQVLVLAGLSMLMSVESHWDLHGTRPPHRLSTDVYPSQAHLRPLLLRL